MENPLYFPRQIKLVDRLLFKRKVIDGNFNWKMARKK